LLEKQVNLINLYKLVPQSYPSRHKQPLPQDESARKMFSSCDVGVGAVGDENRGRVNSERSA